MDWRSAKTWLVGLIAAAVNSVASGIILLIVDPMAFNFTPEGWTKLWHASVALGVWGALNYLKQHPVPGPDAVSPGALGNIDRTAGVVLILLLLPAVASAGPLRDSVGPTVRAYVLEQTAQQPGAAADAAVTDKAMIAAEWTFIASQSVHVGYAAVREHQNAESVTQTVIVGVTSTAGTLALARLLPSRWQRFAALIGVGVVTGIIDGRQIVADVKAAKK